MRILIKELDQYEQWISGIIPKHKVEENTDVGDYNKALIAIGEINSLDDFYKTILTKNKDIRQLGQEYIFAALPYVLIGVVFLLIVIPEGQKGKTDDNKEE